MVLRPQLPQLRGSAVTPRDRRVKRLWSDIRWQRAGEYRRVMAAADFEEHRERARRAQQLGDWAREQVAGERAAAERCEDLMAGATDPGLGELHRQAADLHRQAVHQYEKAARFQTLHADHERRAAEQALGMRSAMGGDIRATADRRDVLADGRDHVADIRELAADEREHHADERERFQDERERRQEQAERRFDQASGRWTPRQRDQLAAAKAVLRRAAARLGGDEAALDEDAARADRDRAAIDRERARQRHEANRRHATGPGTSHTKDRR